MNAFRNLFKNLLTEEELSQSHPYPFSESHAHSIPVIRTSSLNAIILNNLLNNFFEIISKMNDGHLYSFEYEKENVKLVPLSTLGEYKFLINMNEIKYMKDGIKICYEDILSNQYFQVIGVKIIRKKLKFKS